MKHWHNILAVTLSVVCHVALLAILLGVHPFGNKGQQKTPRYHQNVSLTPIYPTYASNQDDPIVVVNDFSQDSTLQPQTAPVSVITTPIATDDRFPNLLIDDQPAR